MLDRDCASQGTLSQCLGLTLYGGDTPLPCSVLDM